MWRTSYAEDVVVYIQEEHIWILEAFDTTKDDSQRNPISLCP